jgi:hypothetical protein
MMRTNGVLMATATLSHSLSLSLGFLFSFFISLSLYLSLSLSISFRAIPCCYSCCCCVPPWTRLSTNRSICSARAASSRPRQPQLIAALLSLSLSTSRHVRQLRPRFEASLSLSLEARMCASSLLFSHPPQERMNDSRPLFLFFSPLAAFYSFFLLSPVAEVSSKCCRGMKK